MLRHRERGCTGRRGRALRSRGSACASVCLLGWRRRSHAPLDDAEQRVAGRVRDLHEPAREVQEQDEQADARREQRHELVARGRTRAGRSPTARRGSGPAIGAQAADHHDRHERERVVDAEELVAAARSATRRRAARPPSPAIPPASANARSFTHVGLDGVARRALRVVPHADRRAADAGPPEPRRDHHRDDERDEHDVVVGALRLRRRGRRSSCAGTAPTRPGPRSGSAGGRSTGSPRRRTRTCSPRGATRARAARRRR